MLIIIQLLTGLFILLSLGLVITVPVALAIPGQWEISKDSIFKSATLWITFIFLIAFANVFVN